MAEEERGFGPPSNPYISYQPQSIRGILLLLHTYMLLHPMASDGCTAAMGSLAGPLVSANQRASPVAKPLHGLLLSFAYLSMNEAHEMIDLRASCLVRYLSVK